jgi:hypothetical protein
MCPDVRACLQHVVLHSARKTPSVLRLSDGHTVDLGLLPSWLNTMTLLKKAEAAPVPPPVISENLGTMEFLSVELKNIRLHQQTNGAQPRRIAGQVHSSPRP